MSNPPGFILASLFLFPGLPAQAEPLAQDNGTGLEEVTVVGRRLDLTGNAITASQGEVGPAELGSWPLLRTGDLMEFVPGMVATQHSGSGKANQYFLRGFNLDHGTDFATRVAGMPVNLRSHGHGQGYTDLNFLIPETVQRLRYRKGPYYADVGDFSSAGSAEFEIARALPEGIAEASMGEHGWRRAVVADSRDAGTAEFLYAAEWQGYDGPWSDVEEDVGKLNLLARLAGNFGSGRSSVTLMSYDNSWNSPDQIPMRAVEAGIIDPYGSIDTELGGETRRRSLSANWDLPLAGGDFSSSAYLIDYRFALWSNFTYQLDDPVRGDQFKQFDDRGIYGFDIAQQWQSGRNGWEVGLQGRRDDIDRVGLYRTEGRATIAPVREDRVLEDSLGLYLAHDHELTDTLRSYLGLRYDYYEFDVRASRPQNSGKASDGTGSMKASLAWQPTSVAELYASLGQGLHSNDARGAVIRVDPGTGEPVKPVDPLVASLGQELGARVFVNDRLHATLALWQLELDSELLFVGDAGNTEASRPSKRHGVELGVYWFLSDRLNTELELAYTDASYADSDSAGNEIPGAIPLVGSAAVNYQGDRGWFGALHLRHFGPYPLTGDGGIESDGSSLLNLSVGRELAKWKLQLDLLNLLDSDDHDIDYFYPSRLAAEPETGVEDIHFHIFEPRAVRASVRYRF